MIWLYYYLLGAAVMLIVAAAKGFYIGEDGGVWALITWVASILLWPAVVLLVLCMDIRRWWQKRQSR